MASEKFETIAGDLGFLDDWDDRYRYLIDLGRNLPPLAEGERIAEHKVDGCASQVWIVPADRSGRFTFRGDSDALIVKGLMALLHALYDGATPAEVLGIDAALALRRLGLDQHLSAQRSNGVRAMVLRIRAIAAARAGEQEKT